MDSTNLPKTIKDSFLPRIIKALKTAGTTKIIGYILLSPALFSVIVLMIDLVFWRGHWFEGLSYVWVGFENGLINPLPFYFGLMAIAGAYLIKDKKQADKKE